jgi:hypothetical protein
MADDAEEVGPEMAGVVEAVAFASAAEWLARAGACDDGLAVGDAREPERPRPAADSGEEVVLGVSSKLSWVNISNAPFVDVAGRNFPGPDQLTQPRRGMRIELVVISAGL